MRASSLTTLALSATLPALTAAQLNQLAVAAGKHYFGTATDNSELSNAAYTKITASTANFGQLTPANGQKWDATEPSQGSFSFTSGDVVPAFAAANGQLVRCHALLYRSQLPAWVTSATWTAEQAAAVLETHIAHVAGHYKGQCYSWDVVNEAIDDEGVYREIVFFQALGADYIPLAFKAAAAADPDAKLYYNDYNIEAPNAKQQKAVELVKLVTDAGARIDGVGLQGHFIVGSMAAQADLESVMNDFVAAGVAEVAYTEFDVKFTSLPYDDTGLEQQAQDYATVVAACLNVEACVGWTVWDWTDKYSWVPGTFPGQGGACLFDESLEPKPAFYSVSSVLAGAPSSSVASSSFAVTTSTSASLTQTSTIAEPTLATSAGAVNQTQLSASGIITPASTTSRQISATAQPTSVNLTAAGNQTQPTGFASLQTTLVTLPVGGSVSRTGSAAVTAALVTSTAGQNSAATPSSLVAPTSTEAAVSTATSSRAPCSRKRRSLVLRE